MIALHAMPYEAHKALWDTLDVGYFMRHDANRHCLAHHASCHAMSAPESPIVRARRSPAGEGLQVLVYAEDQTDLFARVCGYFDQGGLQHPRCAHPHRQAPATRLTPSR